MADRFAELHEIEGRVAALIAEHDRGLFLPWRMRRRRQIRRELRELVPAMEAAWEKGAARPARRRDPFRHAVSVRYDPR